MVAAGRRSLVNGKLGDGDASGSCGSFRGILCYITGTRSEAANAPASDTGLHSRNMRRGCTVTGCGVADYAMQNEQGNALYPFPLLIKSRSIVLPARDEIVTNFLSPRRESSRARLTFGIT